MTRIKIATSTATLVVFDPEALSHRTKDRADWWSMPSAELAELNSGNVYFVDLGRNGKYTVTLHDARPEGKAATCALIKCVSGRLRIGPGEELPGGGFAITESTGTWFPCEPGTYSVCVWREKTINLGVSLTRSDEAARNQAASSLELPD